MGTTTVEEGGAFVTKLNGSVASSTTKNALTGFGAFELNGGVLGTATDAQITNFELKATDSLTLNGKYDLNTVVAAADGTLIVGDEGVVSVQSLTTKKAGAVIVNGTLSTSLKAVNAKTDEKGDVVAVTLRMQFPWRIIRSRSLRTRRFSLMLEPIRFREERRWYYQELGEH